jgi:hypothetical protein
MLNAEKRRGFSILKLILVILSLFGADPDRIGLLGKPPAAEHSFPSKSQ